MSNGKIKKKIIGPIIGGAAVILLLLAYVGLNWYFQNAFLPGTWINGIYVTGYSIDEACELLAPAEKPGDLSVTTDWGEGFSIPMSECGSYSISKEQVKNLLSKRGFFLTPMQFANEKHYTLNYTLTVDYDRFMELFHAADYIRGFDKVERIISLDKSESGGFLLTDNMPTMLDGDALSDYLYELVCEGNMEILIPDTYFYIPEMTKEQAALQDLYYRLQDLSKCDLVLDMGAEQISFTYDEICSFLETKNEIPLTENNHFVLNNEAVHAYVDSWSAKYNTYEERTFIATYDNREVKVPKGNYGTSVDSEDLYAYLLENLLNDTSYDGVPSVYTPVYLKETAVHGENDLGDTYVEVDMGSQKVYLYYEGEMIMSGPIVTGNMKRGFDTPAGTYTIYAKQRNRVLRGANYSSFVNFWMPVNKNIGLHDAPWRDAFGDEIYLTNGSHGCINMEYDMAAKIYELASVGTPVVLFY